MSRSAILSAEKTEPRRRNASTSSTSEHLDNGNTPATLLGLVDILARIEARQLAGIGTRSSERQDVG